MRAEKALAKLAAKNQMFNDAGGGTPDLTPEDIAASLAGLGDGPYYLCRVKYVGDETSLTRLVDTATRKVIAAAKGITGTPRIPDLYSRLVKLGIYEILTSNRCPICRGTGEYIVGDKPKPGACPVCEGKGTLDATDEFRAEVAEIPVESFRKAKTAYENIWKMLNNWEMTGLSHIAAKLS